MRVSARWATVPPRRLIQSVGATIRPCLFVNRLTGSSLMPSCGWIACYQATQEQVANAYSGIGTQYGRGLLAPLSGSWVVLLNEFLDYSAQSSNVGIGIASYLVRRLMRPCLTVVGNRDDSAIVIVRPDTLVPIHIPTQFSTHHEWEAELVHIVHAIVLHIDPNLLASLPIPDLVEYHQRMRRGGVALMDGCAIVAALGVPLLSLSYNEIAYADPESVHIMISDWERFRVL